MKRMIVIPALFLAASLGGCQEVQESDCVDEFGNYDSNSDGVLSETEYDAAAQAAISAAQGALAGISPPTTPPFTQADANGDGVVDPTEALSVCSQVSGGIN